MQYFIPLCVSRRYVKFIDASYHMRKHFNHGSITHKYSLYYRCFLHIRTDIKHSRFLEDSKRCILLLTQGYAEWFRYSVLVIAPGDFIKKSSILILLHLLPTVKRFSFLQTAG